jgi:hypothetical protein
VVGDHQPQEQILLSLGAGGGAEPFEVHPRSMQLPGPAHLGGPCCALLAGEGRRNPLDRREHMVNI